MQKNKQALAIAIVIVIAIGLALGIFYSRPAASTDEHGHGQGHQDEEHHGAEAKPAHAESAGHGDEEHHAEVEPVKGPHGGRWFAAGDFGLEVTIFEQGVEPQFRIYSFNKNKPLAPAASKVSLTLARLGRAPQSFNLVAEQGYLKSQQVVEEPHSFEVDIIAEYQGQRHSFHYSQEEARIRISDAQLRENGVTVAQAGPAVIADQLQLAGEIHVDADRTVQVVPRLAASVEQVLVSAGSPVRKGQVLAVLSSQAVAELRAEVLAAQKRLELARTTYQREKQLWQEKITAEQDYLQARNDMQEAEIVQETAKQKLAVLGAGASVGKPLARYEIRAPIDGVVAEKHLAIGEALKEDAPIFTITDLSRVWAEAVVSAKDLPRLQTGQKATVKASAYDASGSGTLTYVGALIGEQSRTATARIVLDNHKGLWRPGLPVSIELLTGETRVPVAVSADAIQSLRDWSVVFGRYGDYFEARPLELGRSDGRFVEVRKGLLAGERYAASNSFLIKADIGKAGASHDH